MKKNKELIISVSARVERSHSILVFLETSNVDSLELTSRDVYLFKYLYEVVKKENLDYLADVIHDLWCGKYINDPVISFNGAINKLEIKEESHTNFLKKYSEFDSREKEFEKNLIMNDFNLIISRLEEKFGDNSPTMDFNLMEISDLAIINNIKNIISSKDILVSLCYEANALWFESVCKYFPEDNRVASQNKDIILSNFNENKCLEGLYIDLSGLYLTIMETRYNWS